MKEVTVTISFDLKYLKAETANAVYGLWDKDLISIKNKNSIEANTWYSISDTFDSIDKFEKLRILRNRFPFNYKDEKLKIVYETELFNIEELTKFININQKFSNRCIHIINTIINSNISTKMYENICNINNYELTTDYQGNQIIEMTGEEYFMGDCDSVSIDVPVELLTMTDEEIENHLKSVKEKEDIEKQKLLDKEKEYEKVKENYEKELYLKLKEKYEKPS